MRRWIPILETLSAVCLCAGGLILLGWLVRWLGW